MTTKVEFNSNCNSIGKVKEDLECDAFVHMGSNKSPLLDSSVKLIYLPEELGGGSSLIVDRYYCKCPVCDDICPAATLHKKHKGTSMSAIHCKREVKFFFVAGKLIKET